MQDTKRSGVYEERVIPGWRNEIVDNGTLQAACMVLHDIMTFTRMVGSV